MLAFFSKSSKLQCICTLKAKWAVIGSHCTCSGRRDVAADCVCMQPAVTKPCLLPDTTQTHFLVIRLSDQKHLHFNQCRCLPQLITGSCSIAHTHTHTCQSDLNHLFTLQMSCLNVSFKPSD